jgi:hypothetical protein
MTLIAFLQASIALAYALRIVAAGSAAPGSDRVSVVAVRPAAG